MSRPRQSLRLLAPRLAALIAALLFALAALVAVQASAQVGAQASAQTGGQTGGHILPQVEEEDLDEAAGLAIAVQSSEIDDAEMQRLFAEAEEIFDSADRPASLQLYGHLVSILEAEEEARELTPEHQALLLRALLRRADVYLEVGGKELAADTLNKILQREPSLRPQLPLASPALISALDETRRQTLGEINLLLDPPDAEVRVDGKLLEMLDGAVWAQPGARTLLLSRPGYASLERPLDIVAGRSMTLDLKLERISAILRLNTRPRGAEVALDNSPRGVTSGTAPEGFLPQGAAALYRREEFSEELVVDGIEPGLRVLEVRKEGYRPYRMELQIQESIDYQMPPIVLEPQNGQLVFDDFPIGASILVDGKPVSPDVPGVSRPRVTLPPGTYHVTVTAGSARMFSTRLQLADRQTTEVQVRLRPGLALLGVLGGDTGTARDLGRSLQSQLAESERWALIDRSPEAPAVLERLGVDATSLRAAAASPDTSSHLDWSAVQAAVDRQAPGLLYVLAVIDDDLVAREATLWIWGAAPAPAHPDRYRLPLGSTDALTDFRRALDQSVALHRPSLGALAIDSNAEPHPVVVHVTPAGPAEAAQLQVGDLILGVAGVPVQSHAELVRRIAAAESGETVDVAIRRGSESKVLRIKLSASPQALAKSADQGADQGAGEDSAVDQPLDAVAFADLVLQAERAADSSRWLIQLDQGLILMRAGDLEAAVKVLKRIRAPQTSHGVGQATVDYFLGLVLDRLGIDYRDEARKALARAAALPEARRFHDDEAWLQPRARARLLQLGGAGSK